MSGPMPKHPFGHPPVDAPVPFVKLKSPPLSPGSSPKPKRSRVRTNKGSDKKKSSARPKKKSKLDFREAAGYD